MERLSQKALEAIKEDGQLFGAVASALNVRPFSLPRLLKDNHPKLTQAGVIKVIKKHRPDIKDKVLFD